MSRSAITNRIMTQFAKNVADTKTTLPLKVQKGFALNQEVAKVIVAIPEALQKHISEAEVASSFDAMGLRYLPNSFVRCHETDRSLFSAIASTKKQIIVGETASAAGLTEIASNVFTDSSDNVWEMREENGRPMFVCTAADDVQTILDQYQSSSIATASVEVAASEGYMAGDAVMFYDFSTETASFGIAVDSKSVFLPKEEKIKEVASTIVLASASGAAGQGSKADIVEYMRKLYGHNAAFYNKLRGLIESNLSV